ncbi:MAG: prepilin-type N-terminal cleavage/methylation domain-containing protein [Phycisphaerales bacterium]
MTQASTSSTRTHRIGFSLIELVIVVVIIGIIGAIAVPRMSRGSDGASVSAMIGSLSVLNKAIDHYAAEHDGSYPRTANIAAQLTGKTDPTGAAWSSGFAYGPYLRAIPPLPVGAKKGNTGIAADDGDGVGWLYSQSRGLILPNLTKDNGDVNESLVTDVINASNLKRDDLVLP